MIKVKRNPLTLPKQIGAMAKREIIMCLQNGHFAKEKPVKEDYFYFGENIHPFPGTRLKTWDQKGKWKPSSQHRFRWKFVISNGNWKSWRRIGTLPFGSAAFGAKSAHRKTYVWGTHVNCCLL